jgi:Flp pilus assembly protein TadG
MIGAVGAEDREMKRVEAMALRMRDFAANCDGVTAIEFGFVLPPLLYLLMAILQIGFVFTAGQVLEDATTEFARQIRTGQTQDQKITQANFRQKFCDRIAVFMSCSDKNLLIDIRVLPSFGTVDLQWPMDKDGNYTDPGQFQIGAREETVLVRVFYQYKTWLPFVGSVLANLPNGNRLLSASAAFRNEPFKGVAT